LPYKGDLLGWFYIAKMNYAYLFKTQDVDSGKILGFDPGGFNPILYADPSVVMIGSNSLDTIALTAVSDGGTLSAPPLLHVQEKKPGLNDGPRPPDL
jgi:hypothetical protein